LTVSFTKIIGSVEHDDSSTLVSLYTNIPHLDGIDAAVTYYEEFYNVDELPIPGADLHKLIEFILKHNYFEFNEKFYLQVTGTAMGTKMAPPYAVIFLASLEDKFLNDCLFKPSLYVRYIDDIFIIWPHGHNKLVEFHNSLNLIHPDIKLDLQYSDDQVSYLDTTVKIINNNIVTSVFHKPTDRNTILHHDSFHPNHIKKSVVKSQGIRCHRICKLNTDSENELKELAHKFTHRGYSEPEVTQILENVSHIPRENLLKANNHKDTHNKSVRFITNFHPYVNDSLRKMFKNLNPILEHESLAGVFQDTPCIVNRQPPNFKRIIVSSKFCSLDSSNKAGTYKCNKPRCLTCNHVSNETTLRYHGRTLYIKGHYSCSSTNVVYLIRCKKCIDAWYFGETCNALHIRLNGHRQTVTHNNTSLPIGEHFNLPNHSFDDLTILVVKDNFVDIHSRQKCEIENILKFGTNNSGLNRDIGFMSHYKAFV